MTPFFFFFRKLKHQDMKAGTFPGHLRPNRGWCQHSEEGSERRHQENLREAEEEPSGPAPGVPPPKDSHHL